MTAVTEQHPVLTDDRRVRIMLLGCEIDRVDMAEAVSRCEEIIASGRFGQHLAINAAKLVALQNDQWLRDVARRADLVTADGQSIVWAARLLGNRLPERVAGVDLMHALLERAHLHNYRVYVLGARDKVLEQAVERIAADYPGAAIVGSHHGYFDSAEEPSIVADIRALRPDIVFVAMPSPRKEYFLRSYGRELGAPLVMGVGGSIDVVAGMTRRAPRVIQRVGLEWLFRLLQEPRRLIRRYLVTNTKFVLLVARAFAGQRRTQVGRNTA